MTSNYSSVCCTDFAGRAETLKLTFVVSMTAAEATALDPQLRILLEVSYECLENGTLPLLARAPRPKTLTPIQLVYLWRP